ncbi:MAG: glycosyltransferase family 2 protein [Verrucomicrobiales bacterium]
MSQPAPFRHLVLIPSYNSGALLQVVVEEALRYWPHIMVVIDGSNDGSDAALTDLQAEALTVLRLPKNYGKGYALQHGMNQAGELGFSHVLTMDADAQHPASQIPVFLQHSQRHPESVVFGYPQFGPDAPWPRVQARKLHNALVGWETGGKSIRDSLFGFRIYPLPSTLPLLEKMQHAQGFDFESEIAVRLVWSNTPTINLPVPVRYLKPDQGGISHYRYGRDNLLLASMHLRLIQERWFTAKP